MAIKTWDGTVNSFDSAADWSTLGVPMPGDTAIINAGIVNVPGDTLRGLTLQLQGATGSVPTLNLVDAVLAPDTTLNASNTASFGSTPVTLGIQGNVVNRGAMTFTGSSRFSINVAPDAAAVSGMLDNEGTIDIVNSSPYFFSTASNPAATVQNNGAIAIWNPLAGYQSAIIEESLTGTGTIQINSQTRLDLSRAVGADQTVQFTGGTSGNSILQIDRLGSFQASINGFSQSDLIAVVNTPYTSFTYTSTSANTGTMTLFNQGAAVGKLGFIGAYTQNDFALVFNDFGGGQSNLQITTTAAPAQIFNFTNAALNTSGTDPGVAYTGPVAGLQHQYIWSGTDAVAISAGAPNVFLKGGAGGDALAVSGGINVIDGGGGSNFLVGGTGAGSQDTFYVDGRGGVETWSTIVNFHQGDQATIFGFHPNLSTLPFTDSDGAAGYQGLTIHSELSGTGTGVNASITFTGIDRATKDAHFSITSGTLLPGTPDAIDYLLVQYNH